MSDYTPTTEEVRNDWSSGIHPTARQAQFDRWLAEVRAQAWQEGYRYGWGEDYFGKPVNPYRQGEEQ